MNRSGPTPYTSPKLRLEIEYENVSSVQIDYRPFKLTIQSDLNQIINTKWVLYHTDIPCVERLYFLLRATPSVMKKYISERYKEQFKPDEISKKLECLIERFRELKIEPQPLRGGSYVTGVFFTNGEFNPLPAVPYSIKALIDKVIEELGNYKSISFRGLNVYNLGRHVVNIAKDTNDFIKFLHRHCEDLYVFLGFFRELTKSLKMREFKVSSYRLELEHIKIVRQGMRTVFKNAFILLQFKDTKSMYDDALKNLKIKGQA